MQIEVEQKYPLADVAKFESLLASLSISIGPAEQHADSYWNHPSRDFAQTDEAFRMRQIGEANFLTYKGPKLDATTKTRRELELPITTGAEAAAQFSELLEALSFVRVAQVCKSRRTFQISLGQTTDETCTVTGTIDEVAEVGNFVELEVTTDESGVDQAKQAVEAAAKELGLGPSQRRSYLEMLLDG